MCPTWMEAVPGDDIDQQVQHFARLAKRKSLNPMKGLGFNGLRALRSRALGSKRWVHLIWCLVPFCCAVACPFWDVFEAAMFFSHVVFFHSSFFVRSLHVPSFPCAAARALSTNWQADPRASRRVAEDLPKSSRRVRGA